MREKLLLMLTCLLAISMIIGGCTSMQSSKIITPQSAEKYPNKPLNIIVPFGVGSGSDILARMLEKVTFKHLGQPLVVVNKAGATGSIGWNELSSSNPDGYTIGIVSIELLLQPNYGVTKYNYPTSLEPLAHFASVPMVLAVQANQPWKNINEFIEDGKLHPGKLKFSHVGIGSLNHIVGEQLSKSAGITIEQVPFQSGSEAVTALLGGHVQAAIIGPAQVKEHIKSGAIRVLAVATDLRLTDPVFSDVPTFKEQGIDIQFSNWYGVAAPKELPAEIKAKLAEGLKEIITDPEFKENVENIGLQYKYLDPRESQEFWIVENKKISETIRETGILNIIKAQKQ